MNNIMQGEDTITSKEKTWNLTHKYVLTRNNQKD